MKTFPLRLTDEQHQEIKNKAHDSKLSMHTFIIDTVDSHCKAIDLFARAVEVTDKQPTKEPKKTGTTTWKELGGEPVASKEDYYKKKCPHSDDLVDICAKCLKN